MCCLSGLLYVLFREFSGSYRVAGVAVLCYASNVHFASFDSMFIYQTLALPFLGLTLLAAWRLVRAKIVRAESRLARRRGAGHRRDGGDSSRHQLRARRDVASHFPGGFAQSVTGARRPGPAFWLCCQRWRRSAGWCSPLRRPGPTCSRSPPGRWIACALFSQAAHTRAPSTSAGPLDNRILGAVSHP